MPPESSQAPQRRSFLRWALRGGLALAGAGAAITGYGLWEASWIIVRRQTVFVERLPEAFEGLTLGVLADFHHGPFVGLPFLRRAVEIANGLTPDVFVLLGDFAHKGTHTERQLPPCLDLMEQLEAPLGIYAVPGNHDMQAKGAVYQDALKQSSVVDLTNQARAIERNSARLWIAGVDDLWWGRPDLDRSLMGIPRNEPVILLSHNPDFAEDRPDRRVDLMLSGHMHGGQIYVPGVGSPHLPSKYGAKYRAGLVQGPASQVFITRGLGEAGAPIRLNCPPEINVLTLKRQRVESSRP